MARTLDPPAPGGASGEWDAGPDRGVVAPRDARVRLAPVAARLASPLGAFGLLTAVPVPSALRRGPSAATIAGFALAGLTLGGLLAGLDAALAPLFPPGTRAPLLLGALTLLTGALHLDGLMDAADGLFGARSAERRLELMRDSRVGAFGVAAAALVLLVQCGALSALSGPRLQAITVAVAVSRVATAITLAAAPPARAGGLGRGWAVAGRDAGAAAAVLCVALAAALLTGSRGLLAVGTGSLTALGVAALFRRRVGGITGDGHGCAAELAFAAALLTLAART